MAKVQVSTANPYEVVFRMADGGTETMEVYAYTAADAVAESVYALVAKRGGDIEGATIVSLMPPKRYWSIDRQECAAVDRILADLGRKIGIPEE